jgi:hypothetical protein
LLEGFSLVANETGLSWVTYAGMPADYRLWSLGYECSMASLNLLRSVLAQNLRPGIVTGLG